MKCSHCYNTRNLGNTTFWYQMLSTTENIIWQDIFYSTVTSLLYWFRNHKTCWPSPEFYAGIILCIHPADERRLYSVTASLIGWVHTQDCCYGVSIVRMVESIEHMKELNTWDTCYAKIYIHIFLLIIWALLLTKSEELNQIGYFSFYPIFLILGLYVHNNIDQNLWNYIFDFVL